MEKAHKIVDVAIDAAGGTKATADLTGVSLQAVTNWRARGQIPPQHCHSVSVSSGIPMHELRPDVFPAPEEQERSEL